MIGQGTLVAPDVKIYTATHASDPDERLQDNQAKMEYRLPVTIGNNCWIGGVLPFCLESQLGMVLLLQPVLWLLKMLRIDVLLLGSQPRLSNASLQTS